jgi:hypothetical protein
MPALAVAVKIKALIPRTALTPGKEFSVFNCIAAFSSILYRLKQSDNKVLLISFMYLT